MSATAIIQRVYSYIPDTVLLMGQAEFTRQIAVGNRWTKIRIGFIASVGTVDATSTANMPTMQCYFGMCSSTGQGSASLNTGNFIGASLMGNANALTTLTYNADSSSAYPYYVGGSAQAFAKTGNAYTAAVAGSAPIWLINSRGAKRRNVYVLEISRATSYNGTYTISLYSGNQNYWDWTPDRMFQVIDSIAAPPTVFGMTTAAYVNGSAITWTEATGILDSITLWNTRSMQPIEVSAIGASIIENNPSYGSGPSAQIDLFIPTVGSSGTAVSSSLVPAWSYGTLLSGTFTQPGMTRPIITSGSAANLVPYYNISGTSTGPMDDFQSYGTGTVLSGLTVNGGYGWTSPMLVYSW